jgi:transcriptional regulator with XRE-family HTH domain
MVIGDKLRAMREEKNLSQGAIEKRTGLLRCYISRVENGHTVPSVDTLEKMARALEVPMYRLFTDEIDVKKPNIPIQRHENTYNKKQNAELVPFVKALSRMSDKDQRLLLHLASKMANRAV